MAIVTNKFIEYDTNLHFYYFTEAGMIEYTGKTYLQDLWDVSAGATALRLKTQGRMLHNKYVDSSYNGKQTRYKHSDIIEYRVFLNEKNERDAIIQSLTEIVYASEDMDWDKKIRLGEAEWLPMILQPLVTARVYFRGEIYDIVPEDEYQVGY